jgi:[acyl-carrier-protein] S-malonyltransferase
MKAYIFPGQGAQFQGMGKELYDSSEIAKGLFHQANDILGFDISKVMFEGTEEDLRQTKITQPAVFLHSIITYLSKEIEEKPAATAGHSLGEFTALVAAGAMKFEDGLQLVYKRAMAMQAACEKTEGTMAAIMINDNSIVEEICSGIAQHIVVAANYNNPGQLVISGSLEGVAEASRQLTEKGAKAIPLSVGGAFHSPLMMSAQEELQKAIENTIISTPFCPVYQNINAQPVTDVSVIKTNLINQLTGPVRWQQIIENMLANGINHFVEVGGKGRILLGMVRKISREAQMDMLV